MVPKKRSKIDILKSYVKLKNYESYGVQETMLEEQKLITIY